MKVFKSALSPIKKKVEPVKGRRGMYTVRNAYTGPYDYFRAPEQAATTEGGSKKQPPKQ
jgi:hypothetical protein